MMYRTSRLFLSLLSSLLGIAALTQPAPAEESVADLLSQSQPEPAQTTPLGGLRILSPQGLTTKDRHTTLVVEYPIGMKLQVLVNQAPLADDIPTQIREDDRRGIATQVWYNLPLKPGDNVLTVVPEGGSAVSTQVKVQETALKLQILPTGNPRVPADGRSSATLEGQILDDVGQPISEDAIVTLTASAGKFINADQDSDRPGFQVRAVRGKFTAKLQAGLDPQMVRVRAAVDRLVEPAQENVGRTALFPLQNPALKNPPDRPQTLRLPSSDQPLEAYTQVEFITNLRPFIMSGAVNLRVGAAGVNFYDSFRDFLRPGLYEDGTRFDADVAVFAQGSIGEWLLTAAMNNQRPLNEDCSGTTRLFRADQFCDQVYPTYGDSSTVDYLTPSLDSVFVKLERTSPTAGAGSDFALWGDYRTSEFARASQVFTATDRQLHGFKVNYNLGNLQLTGMYGNNLQGFQRDAIAPNGTSGYYYLTRRLLLAGSETVFLETEELNRPGTVIERKSLMRGPDYEIDYDRGSLLFRKPILTTEFDPFGRSLVRRIIVTYQYDDPAADDTYLYAGRLVYHLSRELNRESWTGFSYLREVLGDREFELYGGDAQISLGKDFKLVAEIATSRSDSVFQGEIDGNAYRVEAIGRPISGLATRAYYRSVEPGFVNNSTFSFTPGQTRYGAELAAKVTDTTQINFQFDREINFGIAPAVRGLTEIVRGFALDDLFNPAAEAVPGTRLDNSQTTVRAGVTQKIGAADLGLDFVSRSREDRITPNRLDTGGNQIVSRFNLPIVDNLTFRFQDERNLSDGDPLYPNRTTLALDWAMYPGVTMRVAQQFIDDNTGSLGDRSITSIETLTDYRLGEDTTMTGRYGVLSGVNGWSGYSTLGLTHRITLAPGLRANFGFERITGDLFSYTAAGQQFAQPVAPGQSASSLGITEGSTYAVGLEYTDNPNFKASARAEYRASDLGDNLVLSAAAAGKLSPALTALARYQQASFANQLLVDAGLGDTKNLRVGLAYRNPNDDKFNALLRYEYRQNPSTIPDTILFGSGVGSNVHLFAVETIYTPNWRWEFYGKFGVRRTTSYLARDLEGTNTITLGQFRVAYRLGYRWDIAGEARWIGQTDTDFNELGYVAELGYYLTPDLRLGAGYAFGRTDRDFGDRSKGGFFVGVTYKVDQLLSGFGWRDTAPKQQRESEVKPVATVQSEAGGEAK